MENMKWLHFDLGGSKMLHFMFGGGGGAALHGAALWTVGPSQDLRWTCGALLQDPRTGRTLRKVPNTELETPSRWPTGRNALFCNSRFPLRLPSRLLAQEMTDPIRSFFRRRAASVAVRRAEGPRRGQALRSTFISLRRKKNNIKIVKAKGPTEQVEDMPGGTLRRRNSATLQTEK